MLKRVFCFIVLMFLPMYCFGYDDACTKPQEFTVDKRCYVTDEQKQELPYNAVVALVDKNTDTYCTGTIVRGKNGKPYLYTARHCTDDNNDNISDDTLTIQLQDGRRINVKKNNVGNYDIKNEQNHTGDWAVYSMDIQNVPMVDKTSKIKLKIGQYKLWYDASVVGYGSLKIMSDKEIDDFRENYINYLRKQNSEYDKLDELNKAQQYGLVVDYGVHIMNETVINFLLDNKIYLYSLENDYLKISLCRYSSAGSTLGCQGWGGNSGGPIFDTNGNIMGIATRGNYFIGESKHAYTASDVSLLKSIF